MCVGAESRISDWLQAWDAVSGSAQKKENHCKYFKQKEKGFKQEIKCLQKFWKGWKDRNQKTAPGLLVSRPTTVATSQRSGNCCCYCHLFSCQPVTRQWMWSLPAAIYFFQCIPVVGEQSPSLFYLPNTTKVHFPGRA